METRSLDENPKSLSEDREKAEDRPNPIGKLCEFAERRLGEKSLNEWLRF